MRQKIGFVGFVCAAFLLTGCGGETRKEIQSRGGVKIAEVVVTAGPDGMTVEQRNIKKRLEIDNKPGAIKHLYVISPMNGKCLIYSTVKGKVTSGGKRLTPYSVAPMDGRSSHSETGFPINIGGYRHYTAEVLQDDGTYGSSADYIYWWDSRDVYHQHYVTDGQIIHVSTEPIRVPEIVINIETKSFNSKDDGK